jgi:5-methylcytosine-specific restriction endonuclease McrA
VSPQYEKRCEYYRQRYVANRETLLAQTKDYQATHPEVVRRAGEKYREKHAELIRSKRRAKYAANPDKDYAIHRAWVEQNNGARSGYMRQWRSEHVEQRKAYDAAYRSAHKEERAERQNARRARQIGNGGSHTKHQWLLLQQAYGHRCGYCSAGAVRLTKDHVQPLARGGSDDIGNIIPACLRCNRRKHVKTAEEFMVMLVAA